MHRWARAKARTARIYYMRGEGEGGGWERGRERGGRGGERIDYTPRITLGPFSIIFRWNINRAVNNNPLYRTVHTTSHGIRVSMRVDTQMAVVSVGEIKRYAWTVVVVRANALGANWKYAGGACVFRAINIRTGRRSINYDSCCCYPREGEDTWHPCRAEVLGGGRSCDGRSWNVVYVLTSCYLWGITNLVGETFR